MEFLEIAIESGLLYLFVNAKIPFFIAIDSAIIKIFTICLENKAFLKWLCTLEWWLIKGVAKLLLFICFLNFIHWVIFKNLIQYLFQTHKEYQTEDFKNFQKIRRKRWIYFFLLFFLANPLVLTGKSPVYVPFNHLTLWIIDPFFVERKYFLKDGYYDDFLYINIPIFLEKNLKMVEMFVKLQDYIYLRTFSIIIVIICFFILFKFYFDWIFLFDNFVIKNVRKTLTFKQLITDFRYLKKIILETIILILPFSKITFFFCKKVIDGQELRILDEKEYEEFYKLNLNLYYKKQFLITNLLLLIENFIAEVFNRPKKQLF